jgi:putative intracellular protease/amidase
MTQQRQKFLFVLTSHDQLGESGGKTGFHFLEMSDPYYILQDHGLEVELASIKGGNPPADPESLKEAQKKEESVKRFLSDKEALRKLKNTLKIDDVNMKAYEGIYLPGGHGTMWDFPSSQGLKRAVEEAWKSGKMVAAVCHGPAGFVEARKENGEPLVKNRRLNCFTDEEERTVGKDDIVPFLLETRLRKLGCLFDNTSPFQAIVVEDSHLITGQNPPSASLVANAILRTLGISPYQQNTTSEAAA